MPIHGKPTDIIHDADTKFTKQFDEIFEDDGIRVKKLLPASPNMNAFIERWVQSIKQECLDHFVVLGEKHFRHIVREYVQFYNSTVIFVLIRFKGFCISTFRHLWLDQFTWKEQWHGRGVRDTKAGIVG